ncbi:uncharacterized protein I303_105325 [Kwoniella dejecticola CBS 10117]|uniref:Nucleic acid-binding protein n=1 Tax=Kwoniella dejecticola CBS 10117 TaxID=1296121 RepID=A0A1A6A2T4_9TREE|nr:uncharacterized protein I303_05228 [Kwoniella dejecticola CBS 10117]OBR84370.1 hypothetical protein I303_05228 [Kwoniella dejecticola CBS 10117]
MFRPTVLKSLRAPTQQTRSFVSKAQLVGRLGAAPEKGITASGQDYYRYSLAVTKPAKRDAEGKPVLDDQGYPIRDSSWFTVFNFRENAAAAVERLQAGSLLYVEAQIDTVTTPPPAEGQPGNKQYVFRETSHKVLSRPKTE